MTKRTTTVMLIVLALLFTGVGVWFANRAEQGHPEEMVPEGRSAGTESTATKSAPLSQAPGSESNRKPADAPQTASSPEITPAPAPNAAGTTAPHHIHGRVLDVLGVPMPGIDVTSRSMRDQVLGRSQADGSFDFDWQKGDLDLLASAPAYETLRSMVVRGAPPHEGFIVVAPVMSASGIVVDPSGLGIEGADVAVVTGEAVLSAFPLKLDAAQVEVPPSVKSGPGGAFTISRSIAAAHVLLRAGHAGFEDAELPAPTAPAADLRFVLKPKKAAERFVTGVVVRADGKAATKARVHLGEAEVGVDEGGGFRFASPQWVYESQKLVAIEAGSQAASILEFGKLLNSTTDEPAPVRLVLGPAPLVIAGHVLDEKQAPLKGWIVGLLHPTSVSVGRVPPITAEGLTVGEDARFETDAKGAFRIEGLLDREYDLFAYDPVSLVRIETNPVAAGKLDVEIVVTDDVFVENLGGRVVARDGTPITGVDVSIGMVTARDEGATAWVSGARTKTDGTGAFVFAKAPRKFAQIDVDGEIVVPRSFPLEGVDLAQPLRLEVQRRCHMRVEGLPKSESVRWLAAVDGSGNEVPMMVFHAGGWSSSSRQQVMSETTLAYAVSESAVELRLIDKDDHVAEKRELRLVPGEVTVVRW